MGPVYSTCPSDGDAVPVIDDSKSPHPFYVPIKFMPSSLFKMPLADRNQAISGIPQVLVRP